LEFVPTKTLFLI
jgi:DNA repair protein RAD51